MTEEQKARELLKSLGYFVNNLWSIKDVKSIFKITDEEAMLVLNEAFENETVIQQIWMTIDYAAEKYLVRKN